MEGVTDEGRGIRSITRIRVRYADTDQMGFVYHAKFLEYFEQARADLLRSHGLPYTEIEKQGIYFPVLEASARYKRPGFYDDLLDVEATMSEIPTTRIRIGYKIFRDGDSKPIVEGHTIHAIVSAESSRPVRIPENMLRIIEGAFTTGPHHAQKRTP
ncbi:MAG: acyl-CoA thioesterase [Ignavibacteria bacterium]|nr:acyl-CoA thioesterase [Ignavibacteria bacterium]